MKNSECDDAFVREIDDEIVRVKDIEEERVAYMTYEMKIEEERELAEAKGIKKGKIEIVLEMLRTHQPLEFISEMTKFSSEKIAEIGKVYGLL